MRKELLDIMRDTIIAMQQAYILLLQRHIRNREFLEKMDKILK